MRLQLILQHIQSPQQTLISLLHIVTTFNNITVIIPNIVINLQLLLKPFQNPLHLLFLFTYLIQFGHHLFISFLDLFEFYL